MNSLETKTKTETDLEQLCVGRYEPLKRYFIGLTIDDISEFDDDDIVNTVERKDKLLIRIFIKNVLKPTPQKKIQEPPPPLVLTNEGELELNNKLLSITWAAQHIDRLIPVTDLWSRIESEVHDLTRIKIINCAENNLHDVDMPVIASIISLLPQCRIVNFSNNRLHGLRNPDKQHLDSNLKQILNLSHVQYMNITSNAIASVDRMDFYTNLSDYELKKIIFVLPQWVIPGGWTILIPDPQRQGIVRQAHMNFYNLR